MRREGSTAAKSTTRRQCLLTAAGIAAVAIAIYLPTLGADFVYDDHALIVRGDYVHDVGNLDEILTLRVLGQDVLDRNRPLALLSTMIDSALWDMNPIGYHATNVLLHAACSVLLFFLTLHLLGMTGIRRDDPRRERRGRLAGAAIAGCLFALHPLNSEAVCVPSFREDLLCTFWTLAALLCAASLPQRRTLRQILTGVAIVLCCLLAITAKETGIAAPFAVLAYGLLFRRNEGMGRWCGIGGGALFVACGFLFARFILTPEPSAIYHYPPQFLGGSLYNTLMIQPRIWTAQVMSILWPGRLCADYGTFALRYYPLGLSTLFLALLAIAAIQAARRNTVIFFSTVLAIAALLPVSNLVPIYRPMADRYLYLPLTGICILISYAVYRVSLLRPHWSHALLALLSGATLATATLFTLGRVRVWNNERALWLDTLAKNPYSSLAATRLGAALYEEGNLRGAVEAWRKALHATQGQSAKAWAYLALVFEQDGDTPAANQAYANAMTLDPRYGTPSRLVTNYILSASEGLRMQRLAERVAELPKAPPPISADTLPPAFPID